MASLRLTGIDGYDDLLSRDPNALLIGMLLDQQVQSSRGEQAGALVCILYKL